MIRSYLLTQLRAAGHRRKKVFTFNDLKLGAGSSQTEPNQARSVISTIVSPINVTVRITHLTSQIFMNTFPLKSCVPRPKVDVCLSLKHG